MTYSPSHLFGQPLLIALPKHNLTYEALYEKAVNSLSRYVTPPAEGSEWWKPQEPVEDELKPAALNTDPSEDSNSPTSEENQTPGKIQKEKRICRYFWMKFCFLLNQFCVIISICRNEQPWNIHNRNLTSPISAWQFGQKCFVSLSSSINKAIGAKQQQLKKIDSTYNALITCYFVKFVFKIFILSTYPSIHNGRQRPAQINQFMRPRLVSTLVTISSPQDGQVILHGYLSSVGA